MNMNNGLKYIQYARKSSEAKERQALSIDDQNSECEATALYEGLEVVCNLEESKSAYKPHNRPQFKRMLELIRTNEANAILTWKPDRLCRNPEEGGILLQMLQDGIIKEIRTPQGDRYTPQSDHLILQIHFGMANQFSRKLSQDVVRGLNGKAKRGDYPAPARLGYEGHGELRQRKIKPHPFEAPLVIKAFEMAATGRYSLSSICDYLHKNGLRTKLTKAGNGGRKIYKSTMYSILTNPLYYGQFYWKGELYDGNYEPLISKQLFDEVQDALHGRSKPKFTEWPNPYNGLIHCPTCGCAVTTTTKLKKSRRTGEGVEYSYLHCTKRRGACEQKPISVSEFEKQLAEALAGISIDEEAWALGIELFQAKHREESGKTNNQLKHLQIRQRQLQEKLQGLIEMRAASELTQEEFLSMKNRIIKERKDIDSLVADNRDSSDNWLEKSEEFLNVAHTAKKVLTSKNPDKKRDLIIKVGQNLIINDKKVEISLRQPYDVLLKPEYRSNWLGNLDSNQEYFFQREA